MIATISRRQMHKTIIFCLKFARQLKTNNEQTRTQNRPTCWQPASEVDPHGPSCSDSRVAWDFDSPWITGPMTAHQSVAYVRHIILAPAANLCTLLAIVFLPIKTWIWRHIRRYLDGSAVLLTVNGLVWPRWLKISPCVTTMIWRLLMVQYLQNNVIMKWTTRFIGWIPLKYGSATTPPIIANCRKTPMSSVVFHIAILKPPI